MKTVNEEGTKVMREYQTFPAKLNLSNNLHRTDLPCPLHGLPEGFGNFAFGKAEFTCEPGSRGPVSGFAGQHQVLKRPKLAGSAHERSFGPVIDRDGFQHANHGDFQDSVDHREQAHEEKV